MDEFDDSGSGDLISSLVSNATSAYETTAALNANPLNTALVYGGSAQTMEGAAVGAPASTVGAIGASGTWLLIAAAVIVGIIVLPKIAR